MKARLVHSHRRHGAQPAHDFDADGDAAQEIVARQAVALRRGEHGGHDHGAGVYRAAFVGVVEVFAVRGRAVDEGRAFGTQRCVMAEDGAGACAVDGGERRGDVVFVARCDADAGDVEQKPARHVA